MGLEQLVRILDADPDLGDGLPDEQHALARRSVLGSVVKVETGRPVGDVVETLGSETLLGLLVLDGLIIRRVQLLDHAAVELLGPGDLILPWQTGGELGSVPAHVEWRAAVSTRVAVLDDDAQRAMGRFPALLRNIVARAAARADTLALNLTLGQLTRVDARLLVLFWHLADRFGRVEPDSIVIPLPLSQQMLAELVFARRQTVSSALRHLLTRNALRRDRGGRWVLCGRPPASAQDLTAWLDRGAGRAAPWPSRPADRHTRIR